MVLMGQPIGASAPVYEGGGVVNGCVELNPNREDIVAEVSVKVRPMLRMLTLTDESASSQAV